MINSDNLRYLSTGMPLQTLDLSYYINVTDNATPFIGALSRYVLQIVTSSPGGFEKSTVVIPMAGFSFSSHRMIWSSYPVEVWGGKP